MVEEEILRVTRLRPNHVGALNRVSAEEDRLIRQKSEICQSGSTEEIHRITYKIQAHDVIVSFSRVELDGKATRVSGQIGEFPTESHGRKADEDRRLQSGGLEEVGLSRLASFPSSSIRLPSGQGMYAPL